MTKGERCTGIWPQTRRRLFAVVAVVAASGAFAAAAQKKPPAPADPAAKGAIVSFEEMKQSAIVYMEESGGLTVRSTTPVAPEREDARGTARAETKSAEERATSTGTSTGTSTRRAAPRREAGVAR